MADQAENQRQEKELRRVADQLREELQFESTTCLENPELNEASGLLGLSRIGTAHFAFHCPSCYGSRVCASL